jgi:hypothetical protein
MQVFTFVDSTTLCTAAPLVCKQWHAAAQCPLLWVPRLDTRLLSVAAHYQQQQQQQQQQRHKLNTSLAVPDSTDANSNSTCSSSLRQAAALAAIAGPSLALLQQAVYGRNLLRNPCFISSRNACRRSGGSSSIMGKARAVLSPEQRLAWVSALSLSLALCSAAH